MARVVFLGTPEFGVPVLRALLAHHQVLAVVTQPDRYAGRGRRTLVQPPVKALATAHDVLVLQPARLGRHKETIATLSALQADVFVLAAYGQILRANVLQMPPSGVIGVHASLLPKYRGAAPIAAALCNGERETGITLMLTDAGMDTGAMIAQRSLEIADDDTTESLTGRLAELGADLLIETLPRWLAGEIDPQPQDDAAATLAPPLTREDGHIDWTCSAVEIDRLVRALTPWPGTYALLDGQPLKILDVQPIPGMVGDGPPGTVSAWEGIVGVTTGDGLLSLGAVQPAGKRPMAAAQFALGRRGLHGAVLT